MMAAGSGTGRETGRQLASQSQQMMAAGSRTGRQTGRQQAAAPIRISSVIFGSADLDKNPDPDFVLTSSRI